MALAIHSNCLLQIVVDLAHTFSHMHVCVCVCGCARVLLQSALTAAGFFSLAGIYFRFLRF